MLAASVDEFGGEGNGGLVFGEERETFEKLNDDAGSELARESDFDFDFDEADLGAGEAAGWSRAWLGHPGEDARLAADWQGVDLGTFMEHGKCITHQLMATGSGKRANDPRKPQINILSVQSSKGLEFQSVILIGLGQLDALETKTADQMKLLYVGMTRAKERLMITAAGRNDFTERLESMAGKVCAVAMPTPCSPLTRLSLLSLLSLLSPEH
jgi:superfamily I DNA/RNA helicase